MASISRIDKRIAELEAEIQTRKDNIDVLRSVRKSKPAPTKRAPKSTAVSPGEVVRYDVNSGIPK